MDRPALVGLSPFPQPSGAVELWMDEDTVWVREPERASSEVEDADHSLTLH